MLPCVNVIHNISATVTVTLNRSIAIDFQQQQNSVGGGVRWRHGPTGNWP